MSTIHVGEAREAYFQANGFSEAGYDDRWVVLRMGSMPVFAFPNSAARRRAVALHDLHHVATGYATTFTGEAEIAAWELGAGCADYAAAWLLDFGAFTFGLALAPRRTYRAFQRGRRTRTLYCAPAADVLGLTVEQLRHHLALDAPPRPPTWRDRVAFATWATPVVGAIAALIAARRG